MRSLSLIPATLGLLCLAVPASGQEATGSAPLLRPLSISASGLAAQRLRIETIAENIANAQTTRGPDGAPYRRKVVVLESQRGAESKEFGLPREGGELRMTDERHYPEGLPLPGGSDVGGVRVVAVQEDPTEGRLVYDPGHPDANAEGYVEMPNVDITVEMADLLIARRVYEANATAFEAQKAILRRSIQF